MPTIQVPACTPKWQWDVINSTRQNKITVVAGGRGVGKGVCIQFVAVDQCLCHGGARKVLYACQDDDLAKELHRDVSNNPGIRPFILNNPRSPHTQIEFVNGSIMRFWSMSKGQKRGFRAHFLCLDECRDIREEIWKETLKPMITTWGGHALLTSTFRGKLSWFYEIWEKGTRENKLGIKSFCIPSHMGACFQGESGKLKLQAEREIVGEDTFRIEYLCEPLEAAGEGAPVFGEALIESCLDKTISLKPDGKGTVLGWDVGRTEDPSAWLVGNNRDNILYVIAMAVIPLGTGFTQQIGIIRDTAIQYGSFTMVDTTGTIADSVIDVAKDKIKTGIKEVQLRGQNKENLIKALKIQMERHQIKIPAECANLVKQLKQFRQRDKGGYIEYGTPGIRDDLVIALALCVEGKKFIGSLDGLHSLKSIGY